MGEPSQETPGSFRDHVGPLSLSTKVMVDVILSSIKTQLPRLLNHNSEFCLQTATQSVEKFHLRGGSVVCLSKHYESEFVLVQFSRTSDSGVARKRGKQGNRSTARRSTVEHVVDKKLSGEDFVSVIWCELEGETEERQ